MALAYAAPESRPGGHPWYRRCEGTAQASLHQMEFISNGGPRRNKV
jgi:hypothetical protein